MGILKDTGLFDADLLSQLPSFQAHYLCGQALDDTPLKDLSVILGILKNAGLFGLLTSEQVYYICYPVLYRTPGKDKLGLLRILDKAGLLDADLLSQLTHEQAYYFCYPALYRMPEEDRLESLRILDKAGLLNADLLSQLPPNQALNSTHKEDILEPLRILDKASLLSRPTPGNDYSIFCDPILDSVTTEDIPAEVDLLKILIDITPLDNLPLELQGKVKGKLQEEPCSNQDFHQQCFNMLESVNNLGSHITALIAEGSKQEIAVQSVG